MGAQLHQRMLAGVAAAGLDGVLELLDGNRILPLRQHLNAIRHRRMSSHQASAQPSA